MPTSPMPPLPDDRIAERPDSPGAHTTTSTPLTRLRRLDGGGGRLLIPASMALADLSDRAVRLALVAGYLDAQPADVHTHVLAGYLRCSIPEAQAAEHELEQAGAFLAVPHECDGGDW